MSIGWILLLLGIGFLVFGARTKSRLDRYEFEHRTDGGTIKFPKYDDSTRHERHRRTSDQMMKAGFPLLVVGGVLVYFSS